jgi:hypothetical protein
MCNGSLKQLRLRLRVMTEFGGRSFKNCCS